MPALPIRPRLARFLVVIFLLAGALPARAAAPRTEPLDPAALARAVEEDWIRQVESWRDARHPLSTQTDAQGAVDGVKDGKYGFHAGMQPNPWWQVDLGSDAEPARLVVFNRLDYAPGLHNADTLRVLTSGDAKSWTLRHDQGGRHFGGISGAPPLTVTFPAGLRARYVRLQIPSDKPILFHLDEVEIYDASGRNIALHRPADQSSLSPWSTAKRRPGDEEANAWPITETIARGRRLARHFAENGMDTDQILNELNKIEAKSASLGGKPGPAARALYLETRRVIRRLAFSNPLLDFGRLLFVKKFTQESYPDVCLNHMPWVSRPGGDICVLNLSGQSGPHGLWNEMGSITSTSTKIQLEQFLNGALGPGHVHGIDLGWDGGRVVFGYAKSKTAEPPAGWMDRTKSYELRRSVEPIHIFEMDLGTRAIRQLTRGEWSDLDPTYAANGDIVFVSERCGTSLQCNEYDKDETSCNLYVMKPDGSGIRRLSANKDGDYLPHALDDGSIAYTRWEYHERSWAFIQSIWTLRPDGTGADAVFKQHFVNPWAIEETRSIPGSRKLVAIAAGHHTLPVGPLVVIDAANGINNPRGIRIITPGVQPPEGGMDGVAVDGGGVPDGGGFYATPWALSENFFLASYTYGKQTDPAGYGIYLVDAFGNKELVLRDPAISCFAPMPLRARPRPPVLPEMIDTAVPYATCALTEAAFGTEGIERGKAKYLRISEPVGWPYDNTLGGQRYGEKGPNLRSWTPIRILGDVPLEADGSAHFRVPADTAVYFQLLDENRLELRRMRSFISFQPGEQRSCVGCHETRAAAAPSAVGRAMRKPPRLPEPLPWGERPVSFLRDIQPILDRHCVTCHTGLRPAGGLDFAGGLTTWEPKVAGYGFNRAYETIWGKKLVAVSAVNDQDASITPALAYGARKSKLFTVLDGSHRDRATLNAEERMKLATWIDANAPYHDGFVNKRQEVMPYDLARDKDLVTTIAAIHARRCEACHSAAEITRLDWIDLKRPEATLFLKAPMARADATSGTCVGRVYADAGDPDYQKILGLVREAVARAWAQPRRDLKALLNDSKQAAEAWKKDRWRIEAAKTERVQAQVH